MELLEKLVQRAKEEFGGHLTILKFPKGWRVGFITPNCTVNFTSPDFRGDVEALCPGSTFEEAADYALALSKEQHDEAITRSRKRYFGRIRGLAEGKSQDRDHWNNELAIAHGLKKRAS